MKLKMKIIVQILLITVLAASATAKYGYEYDIYYINELFGDLDKIKVHKAKVYNSDVARITSQFNPEYNEGVRFDVKNTTKRSGNICGKGPNIEIEDGPFYCLTKITFGTSSIQGGKKAAKLELLIQNSVNRTENKVIHTDIFETPENENEGLHIPDIISTVHVINDIKTDFKKPLTGPACWLNNIVERGVFCKKSDPTDARKIVTYPILMDGWTLNKLLTLKKNVGQSRLSVKDLIKTWQRKNFKSTKI